MSYVPLFFNQDIIVLANQIVARPFVSDRISDNMQAALAASRGGEHHVLTDFVARYDGKELRLNESSLGDSGESGE
eukprot:g5843.t1